MSLGPSKFDAVTERLMAELNAGSIVLVVVGHTADASGVSCKIDHGLAETMPAILRHIADQMEADYAKLKAQGGN
jgi:hypothetical protein